MANNLVETGKKGSILKVLEKFSNTRVAGQALTEFEKLLNTVDINEKDLLRLYIQSKNNANRNYFASTNFKDRILLLPQCLRSRECQATLDDLGYHCKDCGKCAISEVKSKAETLGYSVFVLPGGSIVENILQKIKPKACLGVACMKELFLGNFITERNNVVPYTLPLLKDGCSQTEVDLPELNSTILLSSAK